jgi:hypothetical protein
MIYENLIVIVVFAPLIAVIAHPIAFVGLNGVALVVVFKGCYSILGHPSRLLMMSLAFVTTWIVSLSTLILFPFPSFFGH